MKIDPIMAFRRTGLGFSIAAVALISGCSNEKLIGRPGLNVVSPDALPSSTREDLMVPARPYIIGPSDKLSVIVFGVPELSLEVTVDLGGRISLPLTGTIQASGKTVDELAVLVADGLRGTYVRDPRVTVNITDAVNQTVTVDGQVAVPGVYPVVGRMTLLKAIARAQGMTEYAQEAYVVVFRRAEGKDFATLYDVRAIRQGMYSDPDIYSNDLIVVGGSTGRRFFKDAISAGAIITAPLVAFLQRVN